jgi:Arc/MetJ-type ribon-helix-helix transcriptional regulator
MEITLTLTNEQEEMVKQYINQGKYPNAETMFWQGFLLLTQKETIEPPIRIIKGEAAEKALAERVKEWREYQKNNPPKPLDPERQRLVDEFKRLCDETQALHADNPLTDEEIQAEIDAYRRGE